ncbi:hypothetical protein BKK50_11835 [Rodentibacter rarus]|uniref:Anticodon nuclease n=1 Tax=Rodentibacter rarus TaxID=1908260 RepID=A0A1V3IDE5_9PAST|nr:hypothetical protein [Rodentibacter rarus]OOF38312.1 hypothetical protein BKK50_11835 [Rodentibacter rarus]
MNNAQIKITTYKTMGGLANKIRDDLNNKDFVLRYAYNGTGKTCLSMEVKKQNQRKNNNQTNTLYFNAYTEDLFYWNNDFINEGQEPKLLLTSDSKFFSGLKELALEERISFYLNRYADFYLAGIDDEVLYARALNLLSHGNHSIYEPREMNQDNKDLFKEIFSNFLAKYHFHLPQLIEK